MAMLRWDYKGGETGDRQEMQVLVAFAERRNGWEIGPGRFLLVVMGLR